MDPAARRLLFWLRAPFVADVFLVLIAVVLFARGTPTAAWIVLAFTAVRFAANAIALWVLTPRLLNKTATPTQDAREDGEG